MTSRSLAVALFIYNRPKHTEQVFESIRAAKPGRLFVIADGPLPDTDPANLMEARKATEHVDWSCVVDRDYASSNMGCGKRVSSGVCSVLEKAGEAVFLEDDCRPHASFFGFCQELLERYRERPEVMMISGYNPLAPGAKGSSSYDFARLGSIWGWASWHRAFEGYDLSLSCWEDDAVKRRLGELLGSESVFNYYRLAIEQVRKGEIDTWDYQWTIHRLLKRGLSVVPRQNLIQNTGFGSSATHTASTSLLHMGIQTRVADNPLFHPAKIELNRKLDQRLVDHRMGSPQADDLWEAANRLIGIGRNVQTLALLMLARKRYPADNRFAILQSLVKKSLRNRP